MFRKTNRHRHRVCMYFVVGLHKTCETINKKHIHKCLGPNSFAVVNANATNNILNSYSANVTTEFKLQFCRSLPYFPDIQNVSSKGIHNKLISKYKNHI
jgi:hypothetical protein